MSSKESLIEKYLYTQRVYINGILNEVPDNELSKLFSPDNEKESLSHYLDVKQWRRLCVTVDEQQGVIILSGAHHGRHKRLSYKEARFTKCEFKLLTELATRRGEFNWDDQLSYDNPVGRQKLQQLKRQYVAKLRRKFRALLPDLGGNPIRNEDNVTYTSFKTRLNLPKLY